MERMPKYGYPAKVITSINRHLVACRIKLDEQVNRIDKLPWRLRSDYRLVGYLYADALDAYDAVELVRQVHPWN